MPASAVLNGTFELRVRVNDARGAQRLDDDQTVVSVRATGPGTLSGALQVTAVDGFVRFEDLRYDRWESIALVVSAPGQADITTPVFPVRPILRFAEMPPTRAPVEAPVGPFVLELVDAGGTLVGSGSTLALTSTDPHLIVDGGRERPLDEGRVTYPALTLQSVGSHTLTFTVAGLGPLLHGLMSFAGDRSESLWLPGGRVLDGYRTDLPPGQTGYRLVSGALPPGLVLMVDGGGSGPEITGTPSAPGFHQFGLASTDAKGVTTTWAITLPVSAADEAPGPALDQLDQPGPHPVDELEEEVVVPARGTRARLLIYHPRLTGLDPGTTLPLVVFHHGAARLEGGIHTLFDQYRPLLARWASHGYAVASVDGTDLVYAGGGYTALTLGNLNLMAENLRAALAHLRARSREPGFPLAARLDLERVVLAGHSRGAGAAIIAAQASPGVTGLLLLKPVDPVLAFGGDQVWNRTLPAKPALVTVAGNDADVFFPAVDFLYERRGGPMSVATILGSIHAFTCATCPAERGASPEISREQDWAISNAYALAFLEYVTGRNAALAGVLFGRAGLASGLSPLGVNRYADRGASALPVDDFQSPGVSSNALGGAWLAQGPVEVRDLEWAREAAARETRLGRAAAVLARPALAGLGRARLLTWSGDAVYGTALPAVDLRHKAALVLRARSTAPQPLAPEQLQIRLRDGEGDGTGQAVAVPLAGGSLGPRFQDLIVPLASLAAAGVRLEDVTALDLVLSGAGGVIIDDLRFE